MSARSTKGANPAKRNVPIAFKSQAAFRKWLSANHDRVGELNLRCFKTHAADQGLTYRQALDEALCFGWIDGVRRALDEDSFTQRFTPRRKGSKWSAVNIRRAKELEAEGRLAAPGRTAFRGRNEAPAGYSFESRGQWAFSPDFQKALNADARARAWFDAQAPWYQRQCTFWVMSAKKEETRAKRFEQVLQKSRAGQPIPPLARPAEG